MKRAFLRKGWVENQVAQSPFFDLRWDLNDNELNVDELSPGQLLNHFPNNQELTTKIGLSRNLSRVSEYGCDPETYFPRSYDFTDEKQMKEFIEDFERTSVINLLNKYAKLFKTYHKVPLKEMFTEYNQHSKSKEYLNKFRIIYKGKYFHNSSDQSNVSNLTLLKAGLRFLRFLIQSRTKLMSSSDKWTSGEQQLYYEKLPKS